MEDIDRLVIRAQAGDRLAFGELYEHFCPKIYSYLMYQLNDRLAAEDLAEEVFLKALTKLQSFRFRDIPFAAWLYRIARNQLLDYFRLLGRRKTIALEDLPSAAFAQDVLEQHLDRDVLATALRGIPALQRQVVLLRVVTGLSVKETAAVLRKSEVGVRQMQCRGLERLKAVLESTAAYDPSSPWGPARPAGLSAAGGRPGARRRAVRAPFAGLRGGCTLAKRGASIE